ncbi:hypothetical protein ACM66Z_01015 [Sulfurovum sp. ST-21]|uniref:DUF945 domain-containing protein n=1 Tax=Sulfurovum indicum TaxID=2779528 RepID=A0A7M1S448_9BACT|nr:hypothetical protein [Sulfurovum indicum]QOR62096.1 hypothetical protein IMZ28_01010 [Sulfurovum indicum]
MKKAGIVIFGLIAAALIYFLSLGHDELTIQAKKQLNQELTILQHNGFVIENRKNSGKKEHFIIRFDDPPKIASYFTAQGTPTTPEEIALLKGMKIGADVFYMKDIYSALSIDLYPVKLPDGILETAENEEEKALFSQIQKIFDNKKLLIHIDINKNLSGFQGYVQDIDETMTGKREVRIKIKGLSFTGKMDQERITQLDQKLKVLGIMDNNGTEITLQNMVSHHQMTGTTIHDVDALYEVEHIHMRQTDTFSSEIREVSVKSSQKFINGLLQSHIKTTVKVLEAKAKARVFSLNDLHGDVSIENIDIDALDKLQKSDIETETYKKQLRLLLSKGITLTVNNFSIQKIVENGKKLGGVLVNSSFKFDPNIDISQLDKNPLILLNALDSHTKIVVSNEILSVIGEDPRAMMLMMLIPPKEENGGKSYTLIMRNGKTTVNGISF